MPWSSIEGSVSFGPLLLSGMHGVLLAGLAWAQRRPDLPRNPNQSERITSQVAVVLAARDEGPNLSTCLNSLLSQDAVKEIIVVDDHSKDDTLSVARSLADRDGRVTVVSAPEIPVGWTGKNFALHTGASLATTPYILFTDADVVLGPQIIVDAAVQMRVKSLDHLSTHFYIDCRTFGEEICAPVLAASSSLSLFGTASSLGSATGAFNMVRTDSYWRFGGHQPICGQIVDDVALARTFVKQGAKSEFVSTGNRVKVRLFVGITGFVSAVTRSSLSFLSIRAIYALILAIGLFISIVATSAYFIVTLFTLLLHTAGSLSSSSPCWLGILPYSLGALAFLCLRKYDNGRLLLRFFYPIGAALLVYGVFKACLLKMRNRPINWRGRSYKLSSCTE